MAGARKPIYDRRQANRISLRIVLGAAIVFAAYMALVLSLDPISTNDSGLRVFAIFGFSLPYSEIRDVEFVSAPAPVRSRVVGNDAFGLIREGTYNVDGLGEARVFLKKPNLSYVAIRTGDRTYALSLGSKDKDLLLYDHIKLGMK